MTTKIIAAVNERLKQQAALETSERIKLIKEKIKAIEDANKASGRDAHRKRRIRLKSLVYRLENNIGRQC